MPRIYDPNADRFVRVNDDQYAEYLANRNQQVQDPAERDQIEKKAVAAEPLLSSAKADKILPFDDPKVQADVNQIVRHHQITKQQVQLAEAAIEEDPITNQSLKDIVLNKSIKGGTFVFDKLSRALTLDSAIQTGIARGQLRALKGQGTIYDSVLALGAFGSPLQSPIVQQNIQEAVRLQLGWDAVLEEAGMPKGKFPFAIPVPKISPSAAFLGLGQAMAEGKFPVELVDFNPIITPRGTLGLSLDIMYSPLTYLSFGKAIPAKAALRLGKGKVPIVRFMNQTILESGQLKAGKMAILKPIRNQIKSLRATEEGRAVIEAMDSFVASTLGKVHGQFVKTFVPVKGFIADTGNKVRKQIIQNSAGIEASYQNMFKGISEEDKLFYVKSVRARMEKIAPKKRAGELIERMTFLDPKINALHQKIQARFVALAPKVGISKEVLFPDYFPSIIESVGKETLRKISPITKIARTKAGKLRKFRKDVAFIDDPAKAFAKREIELMKIERINNGFIAKVAQKFGKTLEEAQRIGIDEFISPEVKGKLDKLSPEELAVALKKELRPVEVEKVFKGSTFEVQRLGIPTTAEGRVYFPNATIKRLQDFASENFVPTNKLARWYDDMMTVFKTYVTVPFAAFVARNFRSNYILDFLRKGPKAFNAGDSLDAIKILRNDPELGQTFFRLGQTDKKMSLAKAGKWAKQDGMADPFGFAAEMGKDIERLPSQHIVGRFHDKIIKSLTENKFIETMRRINVGVESHARTRSYLRALKDGFSRKEAQKIAFQSMFDYSSLTRREKMIGKRLFGFYTFPRKNIQLQIETLLRNPGRHALFFKTVKDIRDDVQASLTPEQKEALAEVIPDWTTNSFSLMMGFVPNEGPAFLSGIGLPQEDALTLFNRRGFEFRLSPAVKLAKEAMFRDVAKSRMISLKNDYDLDEIQFLFSPFMKKHFRTEETLQEWMKDPNGFFAQPVTKLFGLRLDERKVWKDGRVIGKEPVIKANNKTIFLLRNMFTARFMNTARQFSREGEPIEKLVQFMTGFSIFKANTGLQQFFQEKAKGAELETFLRDRGEGGVLKIPFARDPKLKRIAKSLQQQRRV